MARRRHHGRRKNPDSTLLWVLAGAAVLGVGYLLYNQGKQQAQVTANLPANAGGAAAGSSAGGSSGSSAAGDLGSFVAGLVSGSNTQPDNSQPPPGS